MIFDPKQTEKDGNEAVKAAEKAVYRFRKYTKWL